MLSPAQLQTTGVREVRLYAQKSVRLNYHRLPDRSPLDLRPCCCPPGWKLTDIWASPHSNG
ncbi:protein of unknown function [Methylocaldum szegediense]|uniref:Uncharacterized protein n=1 Tax=Methylocaldum szegediense TaxID=73780 RepID=A0ABN8X529_9GAMM|nr:protein of unknown function [Methylocaldum szegediense]